MSNTPTYTSESTAKSLWQEYRIYDDRLEFDTLLGRLAIPLEQVERVAVSESEVKGLLKGDLHLKGFRPALKLDWANFLEHVVLDKSTGHLRRILFTPNDPPAFKRALDETLTRSGKTRASKMTEPPNNDSEPGHRAWVADYTSRAPGR